MAGAPNGMDMETLFPRLAGDEGVTIRDDGDPAPRLQALGLGGGGGGGGGFGGLGSRLRGMAQQRGQAMNGGSGQPDADAQTADDMSDEEKQAMKFRIANEVLSEVNEIARDIDFQEVTGEEAPTADDIRSTLSRWALNLARTTALPARDANAALEDLSPQQRADVMRMGRRLMQRFG